VGPRLRTALSFALSMAWGAFVLVVLPKQLGLPLLVAAQGLPDVAYTLLLSAVVALAWGVVGTAWAFSVVRSDRRGRVAYRAATTRAATSG